MVSGSAVARDFDGGCAGEGWRGLGGAEGQSECGGAVAVAIGGVGGAKGDLAGRCDDFLNTVEILADSVVGRDEEGASFERSAEVGEEFVFKGRCEMAEFDAAGRGQIFRSKAMGVFRAEMRAAEFVREEIAEANAGTCVVETGATDAGETRAKKFELGGGGEAIEDENLTSEEEPLSIEH
jgi:hypothetical protein